jgi:Zn-dependent alcohol dehydrogenase
VDDAVPAGRSYGSDVVALGHSAPPPMPVIRAHERAGIIERWRLLSEETGQLVAEIATEDQTLPQTAAGM